MAMVRSPTTSCWCLSIDTGYSPISKLKKIASRSSTTFAWNKAIKFTPWKLLRIMFTCSWNYTQAYLCQRWFNTWREVVLTDCSGFILNWKNAIGVEIYGQVANSLDLLETLPQTRSSTILRNLRGNRKQRFNRVDQGNLGNEDSTSSEIRKSGRAARSIPRPLGRGGRTQFDFERLIFLFRLLSFE